MRLRSLKDLYVYELRDLYDAQDRLSEMLPLLQDKASGAAVKEAIHVYANTARPQLERVHKLLKDLGRSPEGSTCEAMRGLVDEGGNILKATGDESTIDAALIACCNRVQHYLMAGYGCARAYASQLGLEDHARELQRTLEDQGREDRLFSRVAEAPNCQATPAVVR